MDVATAGPDGMPAMQQDRNAMDDPVEIVRFLVRENGLERARQMAVEGTTAANLSGDFYRLSVWREVKYVLRNWTEVLDELPAKVPDELPVEIPEAPPE